MNKLGYVAILALSTACGAVPEGQAEEFASAEQAIYGGTVTPVGTMQEVGSLNSDCVATLVAPDIAVTRGICAVGVDGRWLVPFEFRKGTQESDFVSFPVDAGVQHPFRDLGMVHLSVPALNTSLPSTITLGDSAPAINENCRTYGFGEYDPVSGSFALRKRSAFMLTKAVNGVLFESTKSTGIPTHGDAGAPVFCGGLLKGVVHQTLDGTGVDHKRVDSITMDAAWVNSHIGDLRPPTARNSLYVRDEKILWQVNDAAGNMEIMSRDGDDYRSMAAIGTRIYMATSSGSQIAVMDATTDQIVKVIPGSGLLHAIGNTLYELNNDILYKVTNLETGARTRLGTVIYPQATSMGSVGGQLYIIALGYLVRVDPNTGFPEQLGDEGWFGPTAMATVGTRLYIAQGGHLWKVNRDSGEYQPFQMENWFGPIAMAGLNGYLWVVQDGYLFRLDSNTGAYTTMTPQRFTGEVNLLAIQ